VLMRNGGIDIQYGDGGNIDIVFCESRNYCSHTVTWAEAEVLAKLLVFMANKHKGEALGAHKCDVLNELRGKAREVILGQGSE